MVDKVIFLTVTGAGTWTVPADWSNTNKFETIGAGAGGRTAAAGGGGGGGGAYSSRSNITGLTGTINFAVGAGGLTGAAGGDTWFGATTLAASLVGAKGGSTTTSATGGAGGLNTAGFPTSGGVRNSGGAGGLGNATVLTGGGGGGAGGPGGVGGVGGAGDATTAGQDYGGGGGAGAGLTTAGGAGGAGTTSAGAGGTNATGGGSGSAGGQGAPGNAVERTTGPLVDVWTSTHAADGITPSVDTACTGGGGGGSGSTSAIPGDGAIYGGAGGGRGAGTGGVSLGGQGIIIITYTPTIINYTIVTQNLAVGAPVLPTATVTVLFTVALIGETVGALTLPTLVTTTAAPTQYLIPMGDVSPGGWTNEGGGAPLYGSIDEAVSSTADYIRSSLNPVSDPCSFELSDPASPLAAPVTVSYLYGKETNNADKVDLTARLLQGGTEIASWVHSDIPYTPVQADQLLTAPQRAAITVSSALRMEFIAAGVDPALMLDLDFTIGTLDPRVTFSRASAATRIGRQGLVVPAAHNLMTWSQSFTDANKRRYNLTATDNVADAPDGTTTASLLQGTGAGVASWDNYPNDYGYNDGLRQVWSIYVKAGTTSVASITSWYATASFNLSTGTLTSESPAGCGSIQAVGNGWYRIAVAYTKANPYSYPSMGFGTGSAADNVYVWGTQLEQSPDTIPGAYVLTTTAASYGGPRFDYDPATLLPRGLLLEEQRTNLALRSQELGTAPWVSIISQTANAAVAPDGTTTATRFQQPGGGNGAYTYQVFTSHTAGDTLTNSFFVKRGTANFLQVVLEAGGAGIVAYLDLITGLWSDIGSGITALPTEVCSDGWFRVALRRAYPVTTGCNILFRPADISGNANASDGANFYAWGFQIEKGLDATSYIPTTSAAVTRAVDDARLTGVNFSSWYSDTAGTFLFKGAFVVPGVVVSVQDAGYTVGSEMGVDGSRLPFADVYYSGYLANLRFTSTIPKGAQLNITLAYQSNDFASCVNGGTVLTDNTGTITPGLVDRMVVGHSTLGFKGHCQKVQFYNVRKSTAQLRALTEPALDLNFMAMGTLDSRLTLTRASTATRVNAAGLITAVASDAPRFDYDPATLQPLGLLIEQQRTNYALQSQNFAAADWLVQAGTTKIGVAPVVDPMGGSNAYEVLLGTTGVGSGASALYQNGGVGAAGAGDVTLSCWVRTTSGASSIRFTYYDAGYADNFGPDIAIDTTWRRISYTVSSPGAGTNFALRTNNAGTTGSVYIFGFQAERGTAVSSYIPTTSAAVTRAGDSVVFNDIGWFTQAEGTVVQEVSQREVIYNQNPVWFFAFGSGPNTAIMFDSHQAYGRVFAGLAGDVGGGEIYLGDYESNVPFKSAMAWTTGNYAAVKDGPAVSAGGAGFVPPTNITAVWLGHNWSGYAMHGHFRRLTVYNIRKTNAELQALVDIPVTAFIVNDLTTLTARFDGDDFTGQANGTAIATWSDKKGTNHATQATGVSRPTVDATGLNSKAVVNFNPVNAEHFALPNFVSGYTAGSVFVVCKLDADPTPYEAPPVGDFGTSGLSDHHPYTPDGYVYNGWGTDARKQTVNPATSLATWHILNFNSAPSAWSFYLNGTSEFSTGTNTVAFHTAPLIGRRTGGSAGTAPFYGKIAEILIFNTVLSQTEREKVEGDLAHRWGLAAVLPSGHPYKVSPP